MQPREQGLKTKLRVLNPDLMTKMVMPSKVLKRNVREDPTKRKIVNCRMCSVHLKFRRKNCTQ